METIQAHAKAFLSEMDYDIENEFFAGEASGSSGDGVSEHVSDYDDDAYKDAYDKKPSKQESERTRPSATTPSTENKYIPILGYALAITLCLLSIYTFILVYKTIK